MRRAIDAESPRQPPRPGSKQGIFHPLPPTAHQLVAGDRLQGAEQHEARAPAAFDEDIEQPVDAVVHVNVGIPGLLAGLGLLLSAVKVGLGQWRSSAPLALPSLAAVAVFLGLAVQGLTDTIFFRPEVQLVALFCLATLAASASAAGASRFESVADV